MTDRPGQLWGLVQEWIDTYRYGKPSQRKLAPRVGISDSMFTEYKYVRTVAMPPAAFLVALAREIKVPYERVLDAALHDWGYRGEKLARTEAGTGERIADFMRSLQPSGEDEESAEQIKPA